MQQNEREKFNAMIADVMAYYKQDVSSFTINVWWDACKGCELDQISKALSKHATDPERGQFPPKVADIVRILQGTPTDRAQMAWGKVQEAMQRVGAYVDVVFDDRVIHAVIEDMGGWPKLCRSNLDDLSYLQHCFNESYKAYARQDAFQYPRILMGDRSPDHEYVKRGLPAPKPTVIGNVENARLVYKHGEKGGKTKFLMSNFAEKILKPENNQQIKYLQSSNI